MMTPTGVPGGRPRRPVLLVVLCLVASAGTSAGADREACSAAGDGDGGGDAEACPAGPFDPSSLGRPLRPSDLPGPAAFSAYANSTLDLPGGRRQAVAVGRVRQMSPRLGEGGDGDMADFAVLPSAVDREAADELLALLRGYEDYDDDPDTVDGMTSHEIFVSSPELYGDRPTVKFRDADERYVPGRRELRSALLGVMRPYVDGVLTPALRALWPGTCGPPGTDRACTPCYDLVRRYERGKRRSHAAHYDGHAVATAVVSLSDHGTDYEGGLYVSTSHGQREYAALGRGDAILHRSTLLHGVEVHDVEGGDGRTERWSWIVWFRDSATCEDFGHEWFADCAARGSALCRQLHSTKVGGTPGITEEEASRRMIELNVQAADGGSAYAAIKIARAHLKLLPSSLPFDLGLAERYFRIAIESSAPDGHYGMAQILLTTVKFEASQEGGAGWSDAFRDRRVQEAIAHLERAAFSGHAFSQFNLGLVHTFGYHGGRGGRDAIDVDLAGMWFERSGIPEGFMVAAGQAGAAGQKDRERRMVDMARSMGYFEPWRKEARQRTGSGGAPGIDLNLPWPPAFDGRVPPEF